MVQESVMPADELFFCSGVCQCVPAISCALVLLWGYAVAEGSIGRQVERLTTIEISDHTTFVRP